MKLNFCRCSKTEKLVKYCVDKLNKGIKKKKNFFGTGRCGTCMRERNEYSMLCCDAQRAETTVTQQWRYRGRCYWQISRIWQLLPQRLCTRNTMTPHQVNLFSGLPDTPAISPSAFCSHLNAIYLFQFVRECVSMPMRSPALTLTQTLIIFWIYSYMKSETRSYSGCKFLTVYEGPYKT